MRYHKIAKTNSLRSNAHLVTQDESKPSKIFHGMLGS